MGHGFADFNERKPIPIFLWINWAAQLFDKCRGPRSRALCLRHILSRKHKGEFLKFYVTNLRHYACPFSAEDKNKEVLDTLVKVIDAKEWLGKSSIKRVFAPVFDLQNQGYPARLRKTFQRKLNRSEALSRKCLIMAGFGPSSMPIICMPMRPKNVTRYVVDAYDEKNRLWEELNWRMDDMQENILKHSNLTLLIQPQTYTRTCC